MERENINMNDKPEIEIKIFGGTNMIAPAGATAVQNFYLAISLPRSPSVPKKPRALKV